MSTSGEPLYCNPITYTGARPILSTAHRDLPSIGLRHSAWTVPMGTVDAMSDWKKEKISWDRGPIGQLQQLAASALDIKAPHRHCVALQQQACPTHSTVSPKARSDWPPS